MFLFFRAAREGVRGKPPGTAEAIVEDPGIMGDSRGARDETLGVKNVNKSVGFQIAFYKTGVVYFLRIPKFTQTDQP